MKKLITLLAAVAATAGASAQKADTSYWSHKGAAGLNLSQVSMSNWAAGGDPSVAFAANFAYSLDYKRDRRLWNNRLELAYGMANTSSLGARKTTDKIYLGSTYGYRIAPKWYLSAMATFTSQMANGYNYSIMPNALISQFLSPGYLTAGVGFTWTPNSWFTATFSPAAWRGTFVRNKYLSSIGAYGVTPGKRLLSEFGANVVMEVKKQVMENVMLYSRMTLYSNYLRKPQNVDVNWDTQVTMKINKWISANAGVTLIYDDDTRFLRQGRYMSLLQVKQVAGIGLLFAF